MRRTQRNSAFAVTLALIAAGAAGIAPLAAQTTGNAADIEAVEPLLPPGISDFDLELFGKFAYLWDSQNKQVIEVLGNFTARMGEYELNARDAVIWFRSVHIQGKTYLDADIFLWQGARIIQPGGTVETGPALIVTLRTFGKPVLNIDSHARQRDNESDVYAEAVRARRVLEVEPAPAAEKAAQPVQISPSVEQLLAQRPKVKKRISYRADETYNVPHKGASVVLAIGNVYVSQGSPTQSGDYIEIQADSAVLFLHADAVGSQIPGFVDESRAIKGERPKPVDIDEPLKPVSPADEPTLEGRKSEQETIQQYISAVYLEGDVVLLHGDRMIRAPRLYYDFDNDKALILDAVTRAVEPKRNLPIYVRAEEIRQLDMRTYEAKNAQVTTSEFHTPHVSIGARELVLHDITPRDERGAVVGIQAGTYEAKDTTLNVDGTPLAYWPYSSGSFSEDTQAFKRAKAGYNSEFGASVETEWYLFNLLGLQEPEGYDATLKLDYFSERGPAVGVDVDYEQDDYFGLIRSYYIHDNGKDDLGGIRNDQTPDTENRGRILIRHRQFLTKGWELTLEHGYLSDDNFLESFQRNEYENGKLNETVARLLKRQENWQYSVTTNWRINEFQTETERLPDNRFSVIGEPLGEYATWYSDNRAGVVRYRYDERRFSNGQERWDNTGSTGSVMRADSRQEIQMPLPDIGPLKLTPYVAFRGTAWDDSPSFYGGGGEQRGMVTGGIQGNVMASRVYDNVESDLLDVHRLRHVVKADVNAFGAASNIGPERLTPFDPGVEDIDDASAVMLGLRQLFQTKRGLPGEQRTVNWITLDLEAGFFSNPTETENTHGDFINSRPEDSISSSYVRGFFNWQLSDSTAIVYDGVYDVNRGNMGTSNISIAVEREPRLAWFAGYRYIHDTDNSLGAFGANYRLSEKHTIAFRETYDLQEGRNFSTQIIYIRKWPRWYTALAFDVDRPLDDLGINLSIWPEGAPNFGLGSRRYTGLAESVGLSLR